MKIKTKAIGVNRADVYYRKGQYPSYGMELAGDAPDGRRVMAIVDGGAYAKEVEVQEECVLEIPPSLSYVQAAAIIEALFTCYYNFVTLCGLKKGEKILIHGGGSGIGVIGIQLAQLLGAEVTALAGQEAKLELIKSLGAKAMDYHAESFGKEEYDVILDMGGAEYFDRNMKALKKGGRMAVIAFIKGARGEVNLAPLLLKNLSIYGSTIRSLPLEEKAKIRDAIIPCVEKVRPIIDRTFSFGEINKALDYVEAYKNKGKVVIEV